MMYLATIGLKAFQPLLPAIDLIVRLRERQHVQKGFATGYNSHTR